MPSFDIESKVDSHELTNAVDQSNRVISNRFDFKNANALFEIKENKLSLSANEVFQIDQIWRRNDFFPNSIRQKILKH